MVITENCPGIRSNRVMMDPSSLSSRSEENLGSIDLPSSGTLSRGALPMLILTAFRPKRPRVRPATRAGRAACARAAARKPSWYGFSFPRPLSVDGGQERVHGLGRDDFLLWKGLQEPQVSGAHRGRETRQGSIGEDRLAQDLALGVLPEPLLESLADQAQQVGTSPARMIFSGANRLARLATITPRSFPTCSSSVRIGRSPDSEAATRSPSDRSSPFSSSDLRNGVFRVDFNNAMAWPTMPLAETSSVMVWG